MRKKNVTVTGASLTRRERLERAVVTIVCGTLVALGGAWWLNADHGQYEPSELSSSLLSSITGEPASTQLVGDGRGYIAPDNGVCHLEYEGGLEFLDIQGNGEGEGYRWTAVLPHNNYTFSGTYTDSAGNIRECDLATYEKHSEQWESIELFHNIRVVTETASGQRLTALWGDGDWVGQSLHTFHGDANRMELEEGDTVTEGLRFHGITRSVNCVKTHCVDGVGWTYSLVAYYDKELVMPSEERLLS